MTEDAPRKKILIVDDARVNLNILIETLMHDYKLGIATNGAKALEYVQENRPDLILLDIMMPEMDGYEVCAQLKSEDATRDIPVIFITAMDETKNKTRGFELGAVDYITKPFDVQEVQARVKTHLTLRDQEVQIRDYATQLEEMVQERTRQLIHADRLVTLGTFSAAITHEINNPNAGISGNATLLRMFWKLAHPIVKGHEEEDETGRVAKTVGRIDQMIDSIMDSSHRISGLVNSLKGYSRKSDSPRERAYVVDIAYDALSLLSYRLKRGVDVEVLVPPTLAIDCDPQKISQIFVNLIGNAIDAMPHARGKIEITGEGDDENVLIYLKDDGPGIPDETAEHIFEPFFTTKGKAEGTGLGLFIVRSIMEEHNATISVSPFDGQGAKFNLAFPLPRAVQQAHIR